MDDREKFKNDGLAELTPLFQRAVRRTCDIDEDLPQYDAIEGIEEINNQGTSGELEVRRIGVGNVYG